MDQVAAPAGLRVLRAPVGEANVVELMRRKKALLGGEGNGGVIHPEVASYGRDTLTGAALILSAMAARKKPDLDGLMASMPPLYMSKEKQALGHGSREKIFAALKRAFPEGSQNTDDGLRLTLPEAAWLHVRASNTEPILRLIAQAGSGKQLREIIKRARTAIRTP